MNKIMPPRENFYDAVNDAIYGLEEILSLYNPLEIIANIYKHTATLSFHDHADSEDMLWFSLIEYLMSLSLAKPIPKSPKIIDNATKDEVLGYWRQLKNNFSSYFGSEYASENSLISLYVETHFCLMYKRHSLSYLDHIKTILSKHLDFPQRISTTSFFTQKKKSFQLSKVK
jgi:hypothetical protein